MKPYQRRVVAEKKALDEKWRRLSAFINSSQFRELDENEQYRLCLQSDIMEMYSDVLFHRIEHFNPKE